MLNQLEEAFNELKRSLLIQLSKYQEIVLIGTAQIEAVKEINELKFNELMIAKNDILELIKIENEKMNASKAYWDEHYENGAPHWRDEMKNIVGKISETIQDIIKNDDVLKVGVENMISDKNSKIQQKNNIKKLRSAYGSGPTKDNFINKSQ